MPTKISPCLWFDHQAEDAARFYTAIFKDSKIVAISRYPETGQEIHGKPPGSVLTVAFELNERALAYYSPDRQAWVAEPGEYEVLIGSSSRDIRLRVKFVLR